MKLPRRTTYLFFAGIFALACAASSLGIARSPGRADESATDANIVRVTTSLLEQSQFSHHPLDAQLASKLVDRYLDALDGNRALFLRSDVADFAGYKASLAQAI